MVFGRDDALLGAFHLTRYTVLYDIASRVTGRSKIILIERTIERNGLLCFHNSKISQKSPHANACIWKLSIETCSCSSSICFFTHAVFHVKMFSLLFAQNATQCGPIENQYDYRSINLYAIVYRDAVCSSKQTQETRPVHHSLSRRRSAIAR